VLKLVQYLLSTFLVKSVCQQYPTWLILSFHMTTWDHGSDVAAGNSVLSFYLIMLCIHAIKCGLKLLNHFFIISFII